MRYIPRERKDHGVYVLVFLELRGNESLLVFSLFLTYVFIAPKKRKLLFKLQYIITRSPSLPESIDPITILIYSSFMKGGGYKKR